MKHIVVLLVAALVMSCEGCSLPAPVDPAAGEGEGEGEPPCVPDSDGDGICDGREEELGTNPNDDDSDDDGVSDGAEIAAGTDPSVPDSDGDGLKDGDEAALGTDPLASDQACVSVGVDASVGVVAPVDIVIIIDSSTSMLGEIDAVERNVSSNFADIMGASGLDYRVILLANYSPTALSGTCVSQPLSSDDCQAPFPAEPGTRYPVFFHYDVTVHSHDAFDILLNTFAAADPHGHMPEGWGAALRANSHKEFILISDDDPSMAMEDFDTALLASAPEHFGTAGDRNYVWHSIIGMVENLPADSAWLPDDGVQTAQCDPGSQSSAAEYQELSILTGGLRFPLCDNDAFDVVFQQVAAGVIEAVSLPCSLAIPTPPAGEALDVRGVVLQYTPGDLLAARSLRRVETAEACGDDSGFFVESGIATLCAQSCAEVTADTTGTLMVHAACVGDLPGVDDVECTECSCGNLGCVDGACAACGATGDCCPGLVCADGVCIAIGG